jgi:hypothetical protein
MSFLLSIVVNCSNPLYAKGNKKRKRSFTFQNICYLKIIEEVVKATGPGKSTALLSTFRNSFSAFRCYVSVLPAGGEGAEVAESRKYVDVSRK